MSSRSSAKCSGGSVLEQEFLKDVIARLEGTGVTYALTGSIASNFWGIPRTTHDVDVVVVLVPADVPRIQRH